MWLHHHFVYHQWTWNLVCKRALVTCDGVTHSARFFGDRREFLGQALVLSTEVVAPSEVPIAVLYACTAIVDTIGGTPKSSIFLGMSIRNNTQQCGYFPLDPRIDEQIGSVASSHHEEHLVFRKRSGSVGWQCGKPNAIVTIPHIQVYDGLWMMFFMTSRWLMGWFTVYGIGFTTCLKIRGKGLL